LTNSSVFIFQLLKQGFFSNLSQVAQKAQMRGAREWVSVGVLMQYVAASPSERNEAGGLFEQPARERASQSNIWPLKQSIFLRPALSSAAE
jgi:hypothetical protein